MLAEDVDFQHGRCPEDAGTCQRVYEAYMFSNREIAIKGHKEIKSDDNVDFIVSGRK